MKRAENVKYLMVGWVSFQFYGSYCLYINMTGSDLLHIFVREFYQFYFLIAMILIPWYLYFWPLYSLKYCYIFNKLPHFSFFSYDVEIRRKNGRSQGTFDWTYLYRVNCLWHLFIQLLCSSVSTFQNSMLSSISLFFSRIIHCF